MLDRAYAVGALLRLLVNRDEDRMIYIRQSARGLDIENTTFSIPEIQDVRARVKTLNSFGTFSTMGFTMIGLGEPRVGSLVFDASRDSCLRCGQIRNTCRSGGGQEVLQLPLTRWM